MRPSLALVFTPLLLVASTASAERTGGTHGGTHGGGRGRLGQVSGGIATATGSAGGSGGGSSGPHYDPRPREGELYREEWRNCPTDVPHDFGPNAPPATSAAGGAWCRGRYIAVIDVNGAVVREYQPNQSSSPAGTANLDVFIGAEKVIDSDAAISLSLAVEDRWFRLVGSLTRYQEEQMDGSTLTMTMPTLLAGVRLDHGGPTTAFLEGGVVVASTHNDPVADSSITGAIGGVHLVHRLNAKGNRSLIGDAHAMYFESDVKAYDARVGVRIGYIEAALRVLDFNVGPALYGPEVGLRF